jgi:hypothetical protein
MNNMKLATLLAGQIKKRPGLADLLKEVTQQTFQNRVIFLDYPVYPIQRWSQAKPHPELWSILDANRSNYIELLKSFLTFAEYFSKIPERQTDISSPLEPTWINGWMPALDGVALYSLVAMKHPKRFLEVGSGNSTKFARKSITDHGLSTRIVSIDPHPRVEIDELCDQIIREPAEAVGMDIFE